MAAGCSDVHKSRSLHGAMYRLELTTAGTSLLF